MEKLSPNSRLLSHRLRGFDEHEATAAGMRRALRRGVKHIEFDVRATADREILAVHDPFVHSRSGTLLRVGDFSLVDLRERAKRTDLASLEELLGAVRDEKGSTDARIYIDIKDTGCEAEIIRLVDDFGLFGRVIFVSWIARCIFEIHRLRPDAALCFSHWTFFRFPVLYSLLTALRIDRAGAAARLFGQATKSELLWTLQSLELKFEPDSDSGSEPEVLHWTGSNYGHLLRGAISGAMGRVLSETGGAVCIPTWCADLSLVRELRARNIKVAVYSVRTRRQTRAVIARADPDIIFCDDAGQFSGG